MNKYFEYGRIDIIILIADAAQCCGQILWKERGNRLLPATAVRF